jgi:hypothetical protein
VLFNVSIIELKGASMLVLCANSNFPNYDNVTNGQHADCSNDQTNFSDVDTFICKKSDGLRLVPAILDNHVVHAATACQNFVGWCDSAGPST